MFEIGTFIFSIIMFVVMFLIVWSVGFKPVAKMLEKRRVHVTTQIDEAERGRTEAERILAEQIRVLEESRTEAKAIMDAARVRAEEQARSILEEAQAESARELAEGRSLIERERAEAMNEVLTKVANLTVELTTKLLAEHVTAQVQADMLAKAEQRLGELVC